MVMNDISAGCFLQIKVILMCPESDNIWIGDGDTEAFDTEGTDKRTDYFETTDTEFNFPDNFDNNIEHIEKFLGDSDNTDNNNINI